jgi:hypothetical protein
MKINDKNFYIITYPYGDEKLTMDDVRELFRNISNQILEKEPDAEFIILPDKLTIQQMSLHDIVGIRNYLDDIILHYWTEEEEE